MVDLLLHEQASGTVLRHDYERVAPDVLWSVIHDHLPALDEVCRRELTQG